MRRFRQKVRRAGDSYHPLARLLEHKASIPGPHHKLVDKGSGACVETPGETMDQRILWRSNELRFIGKT